MEICFSGLPTMVEVHPLKQEGLNGTDSVMAANNNGSGHRKVSSKSVTHCWDTRALRKLGQLLLIIPSRYSLHYHIHKWCITEALQSLQAQAILLRVQRHILPQPVPQRKKVLWIHLWEHSGKSSHLPHLLNSVSQQNKPMHFWN